jgi:hypothetical protein
MNRPLVKVRWLVNARTGEVAARVLRYVPTCGPNGPTMCQYLDDAGEWQTRTPDMEDPPVAKGNFLDDFAIGEMGNGWMWSEVRSWHG